MWIDPMLERTALKLCRQALSRGPEGTHNEGEHEAPHAPLRLVGHADWMVPALANLIARCHDQRPHEFALHARRFIDEQTFVEEAGDPVIDTQADADAQRLVDLTLRVHRAVHHYSQQPSDRGHHPCPPQMCG